MEDAQGLLKGFSKRKQVCIQELQIEIVLAVIDSPSPDSGYFKWL